MKGKNRFLTLMLLSIFTIACNKEKRITKNIIDGCWVVTHYILEEDGKIEQGKVSGTSIYNADFCFNYCIDRKDRKKFDDFCSMDITNNNDSTDTEFNWYRVVDKGTKIEMKKFLESETIDMYEILELDEGTMKIRHDDADSKITFTLCKKN